MSEYDFTVEVEWGYINEGGDWTPYEGQEDCQEGGEWSYFR